MKWGSYVATLHDKHSNTTSVAISEDFDETKHFFLLHHNKNFGKGFICWHSYSFWGYSKALTVHMFPMAFGEDVHELSTDMLCDSWHKWLIEFWNFVNKSDRCMGNCLPSRVKTFLFPWFWVVIVQSEWTVYGLIQWKKYKRRSQVGKI